MPIERGEGAVENDVSKEEINGFCVHWLSHLV